MILKMMKHIIHFLKSKQKRNAGMKKIVCWCLLLMIGFKSFCWGFYAHRKINYLACFLLPPEMMVLYKPLLIFSANMQ